MSNLQSGTTVEERYVLLNSIGEGGMGCVFTAREIGLERVVAIKFLLDHVSDDVRGQERFRREAKILSQLAHTNIVTFYRLGMHGNLPYIVMEYVKGTGLDLMLLDQEELPLSLCLSIGMQVCDALESAHSLGVLHRDLKPGNIIITGSDDSPCIKLLDFGLATFADKKSVTKDLTRTGMLVGSVHYVSPEHCNGHRIDGRSDIYALGCLLFEIICGRPPFEADTTVAIVQMHLNNAPAVLESVTSRALPVGLQSVIQRALEKLPGDRYPTASAMKADLQLISEGRGGEIAPPRSTPGTGSAGVHREMFIACCSMMVAVLSALFAYGYYGRLATSEMLKKTGFDREHLSRHRLRHKSITGTLRQATYMYINNASFASLLEADRLTSEVIQDIGRVSPPNGEAFQANLVRAQILLSIAEKEKNTQPLSEAKEFAERAIKYATAADGKLYREACIAYETLGAIQFLLATRHNNEENQNYQKGIAVLRSGKVANKDEPWVLAQQVAGYRIVDTDISLRRRMISCQYAIDKDPLRPTQLQHLLEECLLRHDNAISLDISPMFAELIDMYDHENRATDRDEMIFRMLNHLETYGSSSQRVELEFRLELVDALLKHGHIDKAAIQVELAAEHFHNTQEAYTASHRMLSCLNRVRNALPPDCQQRIKLASYIKTIKSFSSRNPSEPN